MFIKVSDFKILVFMCDGYVILVYQQEIDIFTSRKKIPSVIKKSQIHLHND